MNFPENLKYTDDHEWIRVENDDIAYIGITDFAQSELGDLVYVEIETVGESLEKTASFGTVEAVKTTSELFMPVSGEILEFNEQLDESKGDNPTLINSDPYGDGWIVKVKMSNPEEADALMSAADYEKSVSA